MDLTSYPPPPLDNLLTRGEPATSEYWPDYLRAFGLGPEHTPELIRIATDRQFLDLDCENPAVWAPLYAWRALGQLRAEPAVKPLLDLLPALIRADDEWGLDDLPVVFGMIGPPAVAALAECVLDRAKRGEVREIAVDGLANVALEHEDPEDLAVTALLKALEAYRYNSPTLNGQIVDYLLELHKNGR